MARLKIGLIGCGNIAQQAHIPNLLRHRKAELVAFADINRSQRDLAAQRAPRALAFSDYEQLLEKCDLDAVMICAPNLLHADMTIAALKNGVNVYLEKPLATRLDDARLVMRAWQSNRAVGVMGFNFRFNPLYQAVRERVTSGELGELLIVRSVFSTAPKNLPGWKLTRRGGGGVLLDLASHHLDLIRYFFSQEIAEVLAIVESRRSENDTAWVQLRLANGLMVQSFFSSAAAEEDSFEIFGEKGKLTVDRYRSLAVRATQSRLTGVRFDQLKAGFRNLRNTRYLFEKMRAAAHEPSYYAALDSFLEAVGSGENRDPNLYDGYRNFEVIAAAEESAKLKMAVRVDADVAASRCA